MADLTERLAHFAQRFIAEGFYVRDAPVWSRSGILVAVEPGAAATPEGVRVLEAVVFVDTTPDGWELRLAQFGGRHWVRPVSSERDAEDIVRAFLREPPRPGGHPGPGWREETDGEGA